MTIVVMPADEAMEILPGMICKFTATTLVGAKLGN